MGAERVILAFFLASAAFVFICYLVYVLFWQKLIVPSASYQAWKARDTEREVEKAKEILKKAKRK